MRKFRTLHALLISCCLYSTSYAAVVENLQTIEASDHTRLIFELDSSLEHQIFTLENPNRVVIDLHNSTLRNDLSTNDNSNTPIAKIRSAVRNEHDLRVVLDLKRKVQARSFVQKADANSSERLIVELFDVEGVVEKAKPEAISTALDKAAAQNNRDIVIAINAGHGGTDPGAIGVNGLQEKRVVFAIAQEIEKLVNAIPGYRAVMIRDRDVYVGLRERVSIAHRAQADFYIAIHADAHKNSKAKGSTVYALSQRGSTSEQAHLLAEKENNADLIGGVGAVSLKDKDPMLASVLLDMSMTSTIKTSLEIGDNLIGSMSSVVHMRRDNVEQAAFVELKSAGIPSLLIESGYITNKTDARNLDSSSWRKQFSAAIVDGISQWFYDRPPPGTWVSWQKENGGINPGTYTVKTGDTLSEIAERFNVSMSLLKASNKLTSNSIRVGQTLTLPVGGTNAVVKYKEHTISRGETLSQIAVSYSIPLEVLRKTNQLDSDSIRVGQILKIPTT